jgi:hypothetical protein
MAQIIVHNSLGAEVPSSVILETLLLEIIDQTLLRASGELASRMQLDTAGKTQSNEHADDRVPPRWRLKGGEQTCDRQVGGSAAAGSSKTQTGDQGSPYDQLVILNLDELNVTFTEYLDFQLASLRCSLHRRIRNHLGRLGEGLQKR